MVEDYANELYPSLCFISSLLCPTRADNWLEDIDFPNDLFTWLEKILGFPFQPAKIGYGLYYFIVIMTDVCLESSIKYLEENV